MSIPENEGIFSPNISKLYKLLICLLRYEREKTRDSGRARTQFSTRIIERPKRERERERRDKRERDRKREREIERGERERERERERGER